MKGVISKVYKFNMRKISIYLSLLAAFRPALPEQAKDIALFLKNTRQ